MLRFVASLVLVAFTYGGTNINSPRPRLDGKIVGGIPVDIKNYPYQVSLLHQGVHRCGGSIMTPTIIITAAHCTYGTDYGKLEVRAGTSLVDQGGQVLKVKTVHEHNLYEHYISDYDISVLVLDKPLILTDKVQPIKIAEIRPKDGASAVVTGWGDLEEGCCSPNQLQKVKVPIVSQSECKLVYGRLTDRMLCAGEAGKDSCQGDSGGPLVVDDVLVGIVSWGRGCGQPQFPGVYADVAYLRGFITNITGL